METYPKSDPKLNHDSGIVQVKYVNSDSKPKICSYKTYSPCLLNEQTHHDIIGDRQFNSLSPIIFISYILLHGIWIMGSSRFQKVRYIQVLMRSSYDQQ